MDLERCECTNWKREDSKIATNHHKNCSKYDPEGDAKKIIKALLEGIIIWSNDEDGIHPDCITAYKNACLFIYQPNLFDEFLRFLK